MMDLTDWCGLLVTYERELMTVGMQNVLGVKCQYHTKSKKKNKKSLKIMITITQTSNILGL